MPPTAPPAPLPYPRSVGLPESETGDGILDETRPAKNVFHRKSRRDSLDNCCRLLASKGLFTARELNRPATSRALRGAFIGMVRYGMVR